MLQRLVALRKQMGVSQEQREWIRDLIKIHSGHTKLSAKVVFESRRELRKAVLAEQPSEDEIRSISVAVGEAIGDMAVGVAGAVADIRTVLTDEQVATLMALKQELGGMLLEEQGISDLLDMAQARMQQKLKKDAMIGRMLQRLGVLREGTDIAPEQCERIRDLVRTHAKDIKPAARAVFESRRELREAVLAGQPSEDEIRSMSAAVGKAIGNMAVGVAGAVTDIRNVLTDDQVAILAKLD
ncbi:MAG: hypothetical protein R6U98_28145 [Pirellulaceae bacterium]